MVCCTFFDNLCLPVESAVGFSKLLTATETAYIMYKWSGTYDVTNMIVLLFL